jgi:hypothetical protein
MPMTIAADVNGDGVLTAKVPHRYKGRRVRISIREVEHEGSSQWAQIPKVRDELEHADLLRCSHREILEALRTFIES